MQTPKFPQIPKPEASVDSLLRAMQPVISTLQMITGTEAKSRSGDKADRHMAHVFVQNTPPTALNVGDIWINDGKGSYWDGTAWVPTGVQATMKAYTPVLTAPGGTTVPTYVSLPLAGAYYRMGDIVFVNIIARNTTGGTPGAGAGQLNVSLPVLPKLAASKSIIPVGVFQNGGTQESALYGSFDVGITTMALWQQAVSGTRTVIDLLAGADQNDPVRLLDMHFWYYAGPLP